MTGVKRDDQEVLLAEQEALWRYYQRLSDEQKNLFEYYLRSVTIPGAILAALAGYFSADAKLTGRGSFDVIVTSIGAILAVICLFGFCCFTVYTKEDTNRRKYLWMLDEVRATWRERYPQFGTALSIDRIGTVHAGGPIGAWRRAMFIVANSGIAAAAVGCWLYAPAKTATGHATTPAVWQILLAAAGSFVLHLLWASYVVSPLLEREKRRNAWGLQAILR